MPSAKGHRRDSSKKSSWSSHVADLAAIAAAKPSGDASSATVRSRQRSKTYSGKSHSNTTASNEHPALQRSVTEKHPEPPRQPSPNVFEFLDPKTDSEGAAARWVRTVRTRKASHSSSSSNNTRRKSNASCSLNSDSGASLRDHSPDRASSVSSIEYQPATPPDISIDTLNWKLADDSRTRHRFQMAGAYMTDTETLLESPTSPAPGYFDYSAPESYYAHAKYPPQSPSKSSLPPASQYRRPSADMGKIRLSPKPQRLSSVESDVKRAKPKGRPLLYRKFESLNHRVLRHLQEDIAQMEEDLTILEEVEEVRRVTVNVKNSGRQKLLSTKHQDLQAEEWSALQQKKVELVEKIVLKTEQYNRALCAYREVSRKLPAAINEEIATYRKWIHENPTNAKSDLRFLANDNDLIMVGERRYTPRDSNAIYSTIVTISAAILFPLLAFGVISEFFGRIAIVAIFGGATALFASNGPPGSEYLIDPQDGWRCAALYFGFMAAAAIII
ncbi:hypothetical protein FQN55_003661 [Onygenales sp. PD_40]|nr:hypothetical protein FQN55_003661 [Onygenales sp. PD_40]KAK2789668.1 hypothetical protein FQN52_006007 [Onygenales sp. PD_12]